MNARSWRIFDAAVFLAVSLFTALRLIRRRTDFDIYLEAARDAWTEGVNVYRAELAFGYPHFFPTLLNVLNHVPEAVAKTAWGISFGLATVLLLRALRWLVRPFGLFGPASTLLFVLLFGRFFTDNYFNGQLSLWVATLVLVGLRFVHEKRQALGGTMIGTAAALKLTPLVYAPFLICRGDLRAAGALLAAVLVLVFLVPVPLLGLETHLRHLSDYWQAMLLPLFGESPSPAASIMWNARSASIDGTLPWILTRPPGEDGRVPFHLLELGPVALGIVKALWQLGLLGCLALVAWRSWKSPSLGEGARLVLQASALMLFVALFSPLTRRYHLVGISLPSALFVVSGLSGATKGRIERVAWWLTLVLLALALPLRQKSLVGLELWRLVYEAGLLHFALVGLLLWFTLFTFRVTEGDPPKELRTGLL